MKYTPNIMEHPTVRTADKYRLSKYIRLGGPNGTAMRLQGNDWDHGSLIYSHSLTHYNLVDLVYYRHGGMWHVEIQRVGSELVSKSPHKHLNNLEFYPISRAEWKKDNGQYV